MTRDLGSGYNVLRALRAVTEPDDEVPVCPNCGEPRSMFNELCDGCDAFFSCHAEMPAHMVEYANRTLSMMHPISAIHGHAH